MKDIVPMDRIENKIDLIRGRQVMLSPHLALLYGVETRALDQPVKRNRERFPAGFMFPLTGEEAVALVSQKVIRTRSILEVLFLNELMDLSGKLLRGSSRYNNIVVAIIWTSA
jgi:hypothetical protein